MSEGSAQNVALSTIMVPPNRIRRLQSPRRGPDPPTHNEPGASGDSATGGRPVEMCFAKGR